MSAGTLVAKTPYGFGSLGACPDHNRTLIAACDAAIRFRLFAEFPPYVTDNAVTKHWFRACC